jgi:Mitochondrial carrier protein
MKQDDQAEVGGLNSGSIRSASKSPLPVRQNSDQFRNDVKKLPKEIRNIIAGGLAGMVAKTVVAPVDRIKILYQISSAEFRISSVPGVARNIVQKEGFTALWKGNNATLLRVFPYAGIQFMVFERCKTFLLHSHQKEYESRKAVDPSFKRPTWGLSPLESLTAGMAAGVASVITTYPLDLTRAQLAVLRRKKHHKNLGFLGILNDNYTRRVSIVRSVTPNISQVNPWSWGCFSNLLITFSRFIVGVCWIISWHSSDSHGNFALLWDCLRAQRAGKATGMQWYLCSVCKKS